MPAQPFAQADVAGVTVPPEVLKLIPASTAQLYTLLPLKRQGAMLTVAMADASNVAVVDDLRFSTGLQIQPLAADPAQLQEAIKRHYGSAQASLRELLSRVEKTVAAAPKVTEPSADATRLLELAGQAPIVDLLNTILLDAVTKGASDIHLEPFELDYRIRFRIDGACYDVARPPKTLSVPIASRIKVMANLDVAENRLPQDGRILVTVGGRSVDFRCSTLPTVFGESIVLRVLDKSRVNLSLDQIGMSEDVKVVLRQVMAQSNGILLVTGPTGSGKTTTLYSCLREMNREEIKIITTEDPVEYDIPGLVQVNVNPKIELDFALCLRAILRQDPDVIMVGEIRDSETAQIAVQASLTGHLVFSTLHTNDAPTAATRLLDMGVEPFLITSTVRLILAQRLVRTLCPGCKQPHEPTDAELAEFGVTRDQVTGQPFFSPKGCPECHQTGYKGRTGLYELLMLTEAFHPMILERLPAAHLREAARKNGMRTLREQGWDKILAGVTTCEEIIKETQAYA